MKDVIFALVRNVLGMSLDELLVIRSAEHLNGALKRDRYSIKLLWIDVPEPLKKDTRGDVIVAPQKVSADAIYAFWQLWHSAILAHEAYIIFTNIDATSPLWGDLKEYESCRFGSIFFLNYDSTTLPRAKPSMRGMLNT